MAQPPSFYGGQAPRIARLPSPGNVNAPLDEGLERVNRAVQGAIASRQETRDRVADMDLQTARIERERDLQVRTGESAAYLATRYGDLQTELIGLREQSGAGAFGHQEKTEEAIGRFRDDVMGHIGNDPELAGRFVDNVASFAAQSRVGEAQYAATSRAAYSVANVGKVPESLANSLFTSAVSGEPVATKVASALSLLETTVKAQPIPANAQQKLIDDGKQTIWLGVMKGRIQYDPAGMVAAIDKGELNETGLTNDQVTALRQQAVTLSEHRISQARSAVSESAQVRRANASVLIEQVTGGTLVNTEALQTFRAQAAASQDPEDIRQLHDLDVALARNEVTATYDSATNAERTAVLQKIETTKDWQKNEQLVVAHDQIAKLISRDTDEAKSDPLGLLIRQTGADAPPAANLADREAMNARFAIGDRAGQRYGRPPTHLLETEAEQLREQWKTGTPSAQADMVTLMGSYGPKRGREIARQIAPNKPQFARMVELASFKDPALKGYVREALDGWAQPALKQGIGNSQEGEAARLLGQAWSQMPGERKAGILWVARGIYSHRVAQTGGDGFDRSLWRDSLNAALGGADGRGGMAQHSGGAFILPTGMSKPDFDAIVAAASPNEFQQAANGIPKWGNRDMTEGEFKRLTPVLVSDTGTQALYAFRSGTGYAKTPNGSNYVLDVRKLVDVMRPRLVR